MKILCLLITTSSLLFCILTEIQAYPISLPGCPDKCGNTTIPYPFGTRPGCYLDNHFYIKCDTTLNPPKAFLKSSNINVKDIMLSHSQMRIMAYIAHQCYDKDGFLNSAESNLDPYLKLSKFPLSHTRNKFTVVGCDVYAYFTGSKTAFTGCSVVCQNLTDVVNGTCTGLGCCEMAIPKLAMGTNITLKSFNNHILISSFDPCSYAFVVEERAYTFNSLDFRDLIKVKSFPAILDWMIGDQTCEKAKRNRASFACKNNSYCEDSGNGPGYKCACNEGYEGNPYLPTGCQDLDECKVFHPCYKKCVNLPGGYWCPCPKGYEGDGKINGTGCIRKHMSSSNKRLLIVAVVTSTSVATALTVGAWLYCDHKLKVSLKIKLRRDRFRRNGGPFLEKEKPNETFRHYTEKELIEATNNYDESMILRGGDQGTVYKGVLPDERTVVVKKSNIIDESQAEQFIQEISVLSRISHKNVVKLVGCCLETEAPMLVYEYISNGTLFDRIQQRSHDTAPMLWKARVKIAVEVAEALSNLHYGGLVPVIHGNIQSINILLDESDSAKVSDFGTSKFAPVAKTSSIALVEGTFGYLDPEYSYTNQLNEKSDVFSFGVVLVELITGKTVASFDKTKDKGGLVMYFVTSFENGRLSDIVDDSLKSEVKDSQLKQFAEIVTRCLKVKGDDRPDMKKVEKELKDYCVENNLNLGDPKMDLGQTEIENNLNLSIPKMDLGQTQMDLGGDCLL